MKTKIMKDYYKKTGKKFKHYNIVVPDMKYYRKANKEDIKQKGDLFNIGKWDLSKNEFVFASIDNGWPFRPWEKYYLVLKEREI